MASFLVNKKKEENDSGGGGGGGEGASLQRIHPSPQTSPFYDEKRSDAEAAKSNTEPSSSRNNANVQECQKAIDDVVGDDSTVNDDGRHTANGATVSTNDNDEKEKENFTKSRVDGGERASPSKFPSSFRNPAQSVFGFAEAVEEKLQRRLFGETKKTAAAATPSFFSNFPVRISADHPTTTTPSNSGQYSASNSIRRESVDSAELTPPVSAHPSSKPHHHHPLTVRPSSDSQTSAKSLPAQAFGEGRNAFVSFLASSLTSSSLIQRRAAWDQSKRAPTGDQQFGTGSKTGQTNAAERTNQSAKPSANSVFAEEAGSTTSDNTDSSTATKVNPQVNAKAGNPNPSSSDCNPFQKTLTNPVAKSLQDSPNTKPPGRAVANSGSTISRRPIVHPLSTEFKRSFRRSPQKSNSDFNRVSVGGNINRPTSSSFRSLDDAGHSKDLDKAAKSESNLAVKDKEPKYRNRGKLSAVSLSSSEEENVAESEADEAEGKNNDEKRAASSDFQLHRHFLNSSLKSNGGGKKEHHQHKTNDTINPKQVTSSTSTAALINNNNNNNNGQSTAAKHPIFFTFSSPLVTTTNNEIIHSSANITDKTSSHHSIPAAHLITNNDSNTTKYIDNEIRCSVVDDKNTLSPPPFPSAAPSTGSKENSHIHSLLANKSQIAAKIGADVVLLTGSKGNKTINEAIINDSKVPSDHDNTSTIIGYPSGGRAPSPTPSLSLLSPTSKHSHHHAAVRRTPSNPFAAAKPSDQSASPVTNLALSEKAAEIRVLAEKKEEKDRSSLSGSRSCQPNRNTSNNQRQYRAEVTQSLTEYVEFEPMMDDSSPTARVSYWLNRSTSAASASTRTFINRASVKIRTKRHELEQTLSMPPRPLSSSTPSSVPPVTENPEPDTAEAPVPSSTLRTSNHPPRMAPIASSQKANAIQLIADLNAVKNADARMHSTAANDVLLSKHQQQRDPSPGNSLRNVVEKLQQHLTNNLRFESMPEDEGADDSSSVESMDDPEFRELQERFDIVSRYDQGTEGQEVDQWENPDFSLYHTTDRYGFVHDTELGSDSERQKAARRKEFEREKKWLKMIGKWGDFVGKPKMRERIRKGVPDKLRMEVWKKLLNVEMLKAREENVYEELKQRARLLSKDIRQIDLDINRTYRNHIMFLKRYDIKQKSLLHVLSAYAMYNTDVGYCQGMSQLAAVLLMYMDEEDAFWGLHSLMCGERHRMHGFFKPGFPKLLRFQDHLDKLLKKYLKRLRKHLEKQSVPQIYTTKWFFGCFLDRVPFTLALRLWDIFIYEGDIILIAMSFNIMKIHAETMRRMEFEQIMNLLQEQIAKDFGCTDDKAIESLGKCLEKLHGDKMLLPPITAEDVEKESPPKPNELGLVMKRPMDEIHRSISAIQSRHTSRAPSIADGYQGRSTPNTPRVRMKNPDGLKRDNNHEGSSRDDPDGPAERLNVQQRPPSTNNQRHPDRSNFIYETDLSTVKDVSPASTLNYSHHQREGTAEEEHHLAPHYNNSTVDSHHHGGGGSLSSSVGDGSAVIRVSSRGDVTPNNNNNHSRPVSIISVSDHPSRHRSPSPHSPRHLQQQPSAVAAGGMNSPQILSSDRAFPVSSTSNNKSGAVNDGRFLDDDFQPSAGDLPRVPSVYDNVTGAGMIVDQNGRPINISNNSGNHHQKMNISEQHKTYSSPSTDYRHHQQQSNNSKNRGRPFPSGSPSQQQNYHPSYRQLQPQSQNPQQINPLLASPSSTTPNDYNQSEETIQTDRRQTPDGRHSWETTYTRTETSVETRIIPDEEEADAMRRHINYTPQHVTYVAVNDGTGAGNDHVPRADAHNPSTPNRHYQPSDAVGGYHPNNNRQLQFGASSPSPAQRFSSGQMTDRRYVSGGGGSGGSLVHISSLSTPSPSHHHRPQNDNKSTRAVLNTSTASASSTSTSNNKSPTTSNNRSYRPLTPTSNNHHHNYQQHDINNKQTIV